jgi:hypothetical protein
MERRVDTFTDTRITVVYSSVDRVRNRRKFKTLSGARAFAHKMVGPHPEIGFRYAVSGDGIGKVTVEGVSLAELFPAPTKPRAEYDSTCALCESGEESGHEH